VLRKLQNSKEKHTQRRSGQRRLSGNCTFEDVERISICGGGTSIQVTKIASDHVEVAIHQDDSRGAPDTICWWHELEVVWGVVAAPLLYRLKVDPNAVFRYICQSDYICAARAS
jgi:hypothetical protein